MEIAKYFKGTELDYKLEWFESDVKLSAVLQQDHKLFLDNYKVNIEPDRAARILQRSFRKYVGRIIFSKLKNVLYNYRHENPAILLRRRCIKEAYLFDKISSTTLTLRFDGESFPPTIVYNIRTNSKLKPLHAFKVDVIPIPSLKSPTNKNKNAHQEWKTLYLYRYATKRIFSISKENSKKNKMIFTGRKSQKRKNKHKLLWIRNKYKECSINWWLK